MEQIMFEDGVDLYITKLENIKLQSNVLENCISFLNTANYVPQDNYTYLNDWGSFDFKKEMNPSNYIEEIIKICLNECVELGVKEELNFNKININAWINVVKTGKPKQNNFKYAGDVILHNHVYLQKNINSFCPEYTFVYYAQMPDNLTDLEGTLIVEGKNKKRYYYLPEEGEIVIMKSNLEHSPNHSPNSTKNRIVIAGNVGFESEKKISRLI
jgi:hypothetical protein